MSESLESRLEVIRPGAAPPCLETGRIMCRGCFGWTFMKKALDRPESLWGAYPIHCPATGLTVKKRSQEPYRRLDVCSNGK